MFGNSGTPIRWPRITKKSRIVAFTGSGRKTRNWGLHEHAKMTVELLGERQVEQKQLNKKQLTSPKPCAIVS